MAKPVRRHPAASVVAPAPTQVPVAAVAPQTVTAAIETIVLETLDANAIIVPPVAPPIAPPGKVWLRMLTGLSGPLFSLSPRDLYLFEADEAERLCAAAFAEPVDPPEA